MNNVFDINRFGKYFLYDLRNAKNYYWISMLICGFFPIIVFAIVELVSILIAGVWVNAGVPVLIASVMMVFIIVPLTFPVKAYGKLTDKKAGSNWLLLPASSFEKWLSMMIIICVIVPVVLCALAIFSGWILSVVFPNLCEYTLIGLLKTGSAELAKETDGMISVNIPAILYLSWVENILCFTLGAIIFKKAKVGKTFLALIVLGSIFSWITAVIFGISAFGGNVIITDPGVEDVVSMLKNVNVTIFGSAIFYFLFGAGGIFYRIKTMKH